MTTANSLTTWVRRDWLGWKRPFFLITLTTLLTFLWALFVRASYGTTSSWQSLKLLGFNPYYVGIAAQELIIPLVLVYFFSRTPLFRRVVTSHSVAADDFLPLLGALLLIQALAFLYRFGLISLIHEQATLGFLLVVIAALLGGWRVGLGVGLLTMLAIGLVEYMGFNGRDVYAVSEYVEYFVLKYMGAITAVWVGLVVGFVAEQLGEQRFRPLVALGAALAAELAAFGFLFLTLDYFDYYVERFIPGTAMTVVGMAAFLLMVRTVQDEENRRRAEAAQLELAQTNLTLTQTQLALAQAELRALQAQINPHFFFNSLNTIRYFIRTDPDVARSLLIKLSEIFQRALSAGETVALREEISHVEAYLALEKARLDERLQVVWTNLAKNLLDHPIPTLVLQPIVENAVIHGVSKKTEGGVVHIVITRVGEELLLQVEDDGPGFDVARWRRGPQPGEEPEPARTDTGTMIPGIPAPSIGLRNVDERLRLLYGEPYRLAIESEPGQGTRVMIRVPLKRPESA